MRKIVSDFINTLSIQCKDYKLVNHKGYILVTCPACGLDRWVKLHNIRHNTTKGTYTGLCRPCQATQRMNIIRFTGVIPKESRVRAGLKTRGKFVSEETRSKLSTSKSAFYATDEGKVVKARYSINHLGKKMSPETCAKMSKSHKKMWEDPEYKHATILKLHTAGATMKPNKPETILMNLLEKLYPGEWIYNGNNDQDIVINGCVPDFVSTTRMSLCEVFGNFWHSSADRILRVNQTEQGRIQAYKESGYDCLVVWEHELDDLDLVTGKVQTFCACTPKKILGG